MPDSHDDKLIRATSLDNAPNVRLVSQENAQQSDSIETSAVDADAGLPSPAECSPDAGLQEDVDAVHRLVSASEEVSHSTDGSCSPQLSVKPLPRNTTSSREGTRRVPAILLYVLACVVAVLLAPSMDIWRARTVYKLAPLLPSPADASRDELATDRVALDEYAKALQSNHDRAGQLGLYHELEASRLAQYGRKDVGRVAIVINSLVDAYHNHYDSEFAIQEIMKQIEFCADHDDGVRIFPRLDRRVVLPRLTTERLRNLSDIAWETGHARDSICLDQLVLAMFDNEPINSFSGIESDLAERYDQIGEHGRALTLWIDAYERGLKWRSVAASAGRLAGIAQDLAYFQRYREARPLLAMALEMVESQRSAHQVDDMIAPLKAGIAFADQQDAASKNSDRKIEKNETHVDVDLMVRQSRKLLHG